MKKQYRLFETHSFKYDIELYHDGNLVEVLKVWAIELNDEINRLEEQGYTYGFTKEEVEKEKKHYEKMLENII